MKIDHLSFRLKASLDMIWMSITQIPINLKVWAVFWIHDLKTAPKAVIIYRLREIIGLEKKWGKPKTIFNRLYNIWFVLPDTPKKKLPLIIFVEKN